MQDFIREPQRDIPVVAAVDLCVLGGSCTGVFAAVRAARLGAKVVLVEKTNAFGGTATNGLISVWHSNMDTEYKLEIMSGLTQEMLKRLESRGASLRHPRNPSIGYRFNGAELKIELDQLIREHPTIQPMLHTMVCAPVLDANRITAVLIENKDGRQAIRANMFVDATGDGDLAAQVGIPFTVTPHLQPPTTAAHLLNYHVDGFNFREMYTAHHQEFGLAMDSGWDCTLPGLPGITMLAQTHVFDANCADAKQLTYAEMEGRRQIRAIMDMLRKYGPQGENFSVVQFPTHIGVRETRRFEAEYKLTENDVLWGKRFDDAIAQGSYRVDVHHPSGGGFLFKYLDGTTQDSYQGVSTRGRWREPIEKDPTFYQIPYRTMVHRKIANLVMAGRMISADGPAFGAIRVMVNMNQTGEAAGVAAMLALKHACPTAELSPKLLRDTLAEGGSVML